MSPTPYNLTYRPPAPALLLNLRLPGDSEDIGPFSVIVDTGADATLIPGVYLSQLGAPIWNEAYVRSQWGERRHVYTYLVDLHLDTCTLPGIVVIGDAQGTEIVLGRNVPNKLILLLDGPQGILHLLAQCPRKLQYK